MPLKRIIPAAALTFAIASTGVAVAFAASMPAPTAPAPASLVPQIPIAATTTSRTVAKTQSGPLTSTPSPTRGVVQSNAIPAGPVDTTTTTVTAPLPIACVYPPAVGAPTNPTDPSAPPPRAPAPTPTVTAVYPPDTCPPYVAYP